MFLKVHVLEDEDLEALIEDGSCTSLEDLDVNETDFNWDYHQIVLVDDDKKERIIWQDNMHSNVEDNIESFIDGFKYAGNEAEVDEIAMMYDDVLNNYGGVTYRQNKCFITNPQLFQVISVDYYQRRRKYLKSNLQLSIWVSNPIVDFRQEHTEMYDRI